MWIDWCCFFFDCSCCFASSVAVLALAGAGVTQSGVALNGTGHASSWVDSIETGVSSSVQVACTGAGGVASTGAVVPASTGLYFLWLELGVLLRLVAFVFASSGVIFVSTGAGVPSTGAGVPSSRVAWTDVGFTGSSVASNRVASNAAGVFEWGWCCLCCFEQAGWRRNCERCCFNWGRFL